MVDVVDVGKGDYYVFVVWDVNVGKMCYVVFLGFVEVWSRIGVWVFVLRC